MGEGGGGAFYAFIQPLLPCKLKWTKEEKEMRDKERKLLEHTLLIKMKSSIIGY